MSRKNWPAEKIFSRIANNKSNRTYWDNIRELRSRNDVSIFNTCVKLTHSLKPKDRITGFDILAQLGLVSRPFFTESRKLFFESLNREKNPEVLPSILNAIGNNNANLEDSEISLLISFKNHMDERVRAGLVSALLSVDKKLAVETLVVLTRDEVASIRDWATFGIGTQIDRNNKMIREALWARVVDADQDTRYEAIVGLAKRKETKVKEIIKNELLTFEFGSLILEAIEELNATEFVALLKENFRKAKKETGISKAWLEDLKSCIKNLESM